MATLHRTVNSFSFRACKHPSHRKQMGKSAKKLNYGTTGMVGKRLRKRFMKKGIHLKNIIRKVFKTKDAANQITEEAKHLEIEIKECFNRLSFTKEQRERIYHEIIDNI